jgi:hypothetical protein
MARCPDWNCRCTTIGCRVSSTNEMLRPARARLQGHRPTPASPARLCPDDQPRVLAAHCLGRRCGIAHGAGAWTPLSPASLTQRIARSEPCRKAGSSPPSSTAICTCPPTTVTANPIRFECESRFSTLLGFQLAGASGKYLANCLPTDPDYIDEAGVTAAFHSTSASPWPRARIRELNVQWDAINVRQQSPYARVASFWTLDAPISHGKIRRPSAVRGHLCRNYACTALAPQEKTGRRDIRVREGVSPDH